MRPEAYCRDDLFSAGRPIPAHDPKVITLYPRVADDIIRLDVSPAS